MDNALRLVIAKSPFLLNEAPKALRALNSRSPLAQRRAERAIEYALSDPQATFTEDERLALAQLISGDAGEVRNLDIRLRVSADEKSEVQHMAEEAGMTVSDFIRSKIGLTD